MIAERRNTYEDDSNDEEEGKDENNMMEKINNLAEILKNRKSIII